MQDPDLIRDMWRTFWRSLILCVALLWVLPVACSHMR